ncbi:MAG: glycosyltransferase family 4 protein [Candidatus Paraprevotella stercoravium]|uniref:Glycosyltransferase family 4 protein n=2 Tax=Bacteroidales TaxID=171549 RepID=A0ABT7U603_9BACE|nr:glycosyltransferase family 4 protein [Candidatus Paraprevotella stercoravium]MDM8145951.1 glycosyltransferase family 4 protein [Bacteroides eggerthii]
MTDSKNIKKILFCDNTLWGLVNFRGEVMKAFVQKGHEVVLVAPEEDLQDMFACLPENVRFIPIEMKRCSQNPLSDLPYMKRLYHIYRKEKPDYIFHYTIKPNIYGMLTAAMLGIKASAMVAGLGSSSSFKGIKFKLLLGLLKVSLSRCHHVFSLNRETCDFLLKSKICTPEQLIWLKGGEGVNLERFTPPADSNDIKKSGIPIFLMVARILKEKGYYEFIEAARLLKEKGYEARFALLGPIDGSNPSHITLEEIEEQVSAGILEYWGTTSKIEESLSDPNIVVVLPSFYAEGLNRSLMEACAMARPIITTDIPGCRECVRDGENGFLIEPKSVDSLLNALEKYMALKPEERMRFSRNSRKLAENHFDIHKVIDEYFEIIGD